jgi:hypothetical protein
VATGNREKRGGFDLRAIPTDAKLFWLGSNLQHDLTATITRVRVCLGFGRISQRKSFGNAEMTLASEMAL